MGFDDIPIPEIRLPETFEDFCRPIIILKEPLYTKQEVAKMVMKHDAFIKEQLLKEKQIN